MYERNPVVRILCMIGFRIAFFSGLLQEEK